MGQQGNEEHGRPGQEPAAPKDKKSAGKSGKPAMDDVPSTEEEIKPGLNQDTAPGESFSSEPPDEAAGSTDNR